MNLIRLVPVLLGLGSLSLSACGLPLFEDQSWNPWSRSSHPSAKSKPVRAAAPAPTPRTAARPNGDGAAGQSSSAASKQADGGAPVNLIGLEEQQLRALLGPPAAEEERPPAKIWRYRKGGCTLNLSLYPDVQTRKFGTLTYEVKSDDNTDEGKRVCLADLQSRVQAR